MFAGELGVGGDKVRAAAVDLLRHGEVSVVVMCHTRELAYQIRDEYNRFSKYMPEITTGVFYGGTPIKTDMEILKNKDTCPHIIVGTPGRLKALVRDKALRLGSVRIFVLDECDKMLDQPGEFTCILARCAQTDFT